MQAAGIRPWYREPWPWFLMAIPAVSVVVGVIMATLAIRTEDGLVADDYYKRGLAINRELARDDAARVDGLHAQLWFEPTGGRVRIALAGSGQPATAGMRLTFVHPTRAGFDRSVDLTPAGAGMYEGVVGPLAAGRWQVTLEDNAHAWRIGGSLQLPQDGTTELAPGGREPEGGG
jgi:hypothetical protein